MNPFLPFRLERRGRLAAVFLLAVGATSHAIAQAPLPTAPPIFGSHLQSPYNPPYAAITYPAANPTSQSTTVFTPGAGNKFALVGVPPGQAVNVVVQYPADQALQIVNLVPLEGGLILPPDVATSVQPPVDPSVASLKTPAVSLVISVDGTLSFTFIAGSEPGQYRITLREQGQTQALVLQFYALDAQNPQQNPGCITASNPDY